MRRTSLGRIEPKRACPQGSHACFSLPVRCEKLRMDAAVNRIGVSCFKLVIHSHSSSFALVQRAMFSPAVCKPNSVVGPPSVSMVLLPSPGPRPHQPLRQPSKTRCAGPSTTRGRAVSSRLAAEFTSLVSRGPAVDRHGARVCARRSFPHGGQDAAIEKRDEIGLPDGAEPVGDIVARQRSPASSMMNRLVCDDGQLRLHGASGAFCEHGCDEVDGHAPTQLTSPARRRPKPPHADAQWRAVG
jgi:hypothetical protein